ncbi:MAG: PorV/PorQ family protein [Elusimicrobia bacterium]|nr:PorV/PorQ family protein [Elusimicrobiota bacterium]
MKNLWATAGALWGLALAAGAATTEGLSTPFLSMGAGARAAALGQAYTAVANDATAVYWNPAALPFLHRRTVTLMHGALVGSAMTYDYAAFGQKWGRHGGVGVGLQHLSAGGLVLADASGARQGEFKPRDFAGSLAVGGQWSGAAVGATVKLVRRQVVNTAQTLAYDVGVLSPFYFGNRLRLGAAATNLGGALKFDQVKEKIPATHRGGAVVRFSPRAFASVEAEKKTGARAALRVGGEYALDWKTGALALRAGYDSGLTEDRGAAGFTVGLGLGFDNVKVDYALIPNREGDVSHLLSLTTWF